MWDPKQYLKFEAHRARPFHELVERISHETPTYVVDLGCGPGNLTAALSRRWPTAQVVGVDSDAAMIQAAREHESPPRLTFQLRDLREWQPDEPVDVLVSNATLQWVPEHLELLARLAAHLAPGGTLAFQVPANFAEPTHTALLDLRRDEPWRDLLAEDDRSAGVHEPADYLGALAAAGLEPDVWEATYVQVLQGENPVLEWVKGTALRPVLARLDERQQSEFLREYGERMRQAYPPRAYGTPLPYRRIFAVGRRSGGVPAPRATRLAHVQAAIPPGGEPQGRAFYAGLLGLVEVPKPEPLASRGGCWFLGRGVELHLGIEADFHPWRKSHVALLVPDLDGLARVLHAGGRPVEWDDNLPGHRRFYTDDPFGNRVELIAAQA